MRIHLQSVCVLACAAALGLLGAPSSASACGGCFAPQNPTGTPTVVTRHQMAVAMGPTQTTLWDQIEYAGDAEDFVWVLPVRGGVAVELADNAFFEALEQETQIFMTAPLPPVLSCTDPCGGFFGGLASSDRAFRSENGMPPPVTVYHQATIGPYETVTIGSEDPTALVDWLRERDYSVPDEMLPTIQHYVDENMDFAVLRLSPGAGVNQMQPVRVSMPGMNPTFPLRMVAAGVSDSVGLELFVFGEGRYGPTNFGSSEVAREELTFDWDTLRFNYDEAYLVAAAEHEGRTWVTEFAGEPTQVADYVSYDDDGEPHFARDDWAIVRESVEAPYLSRLTANLAVADLGEDLILGASEGGDLPAQITVTNELNRQPDAVCPQRVCGDTSPTNGGPSEVGWRGGRGDGLCAVQSGRESGAGFGAALLIAGLALSLRRRRA